MVRQLSAIDCTWRGHFEQSGVREHDLEVLTPSFARCADGSA